jgi:hypothetical protein
MLRWVNIPPGFITQCVFFNIHEFLGVSLIAHTSPNCLNEAGSEDVRG